MNEADKSDERDDSWGENAAGGKCHQHEEGDEQGAHQARILQFVGSGQLR
ncbi:hypothetical protein NN6n1_01240 [Shinella zoogloeoides]